MCEQYVAVAAEPFRIGDLWPMTERLERYGLAGFGWGATWLTADGELGSHRDIGTFREDPARERVGGEWTRALLVHPAAAVEVLDDRDPGYPTLR